MPGDTFQRTFGSPGTYDYLCVIHPEMLGRVVVTAAGGEPLPPPDQTLPDPTAPNPVPSPTSPAPGAAPRGDVNIVDNAFRPGTKTIATGTSLVWSNTGALPHTVTKSGSFDSGILMPGDTYRRTFNTPGTYDYICTLHAGMTGTVVVSGAATGSDDVDAVEVSSELSPGVSLVATDADVRIFDNGYDPSELTVTAGSAVTWSNTGALPHTVTARGGSFDSAFLLGGDDFRITLSESGTFEYFCTIHPEMVATVIVLSGDGASSGGQESATPTPVETSLDETAASAASAGSTTAEVSVVDLDYEPRSISVDTGTTIRWVNNGDLPHTVTAGNEVFDSGIMASGAMIEWTSSEPGTFEYFCTLHPSMVGTVIVTAPQSGPVVAAGLAGPGASGTPSLVIAVVLASGLLGASVVLAGGMAAFGRYAAADAVSGTPKRSG
jgi:plastocyanin